MVEKKEASENIDITHFPANQHCPEEIVEFYMRHWYEMDDDEIKDLRDKVTEELEVMDVLCLYEDEKLASIRSFQIDGNHSVMATDPIYRGKGYGTRLTKESIEMIIAHSKPELPTITIVTSPDSEGVISNMQKFFGDRVKWVTHN